MRLVAVPGLALIAGLVACASSGTTGPELDPEKITFAPALEIDFSKMTKTASGLWYQDLTVGTGAEVRPGNLARVTYSGWLPNGTLFDSRTDASNPLEFPLGNGSVIAGWDEGVAGMRVGGLRKLVIPPALGYGNRAVGPIPANSVLVFRIGLVAIRL